MLSGPWIEYEDLNGPGYAQPDHVVLGPPAPGTSLKAYIVLVECKLSFYPGAREELTRLYLPLVKEVWPAVRYFSYLTFKNPSGFIGRSLPHPGKLVEFATHEGVNHWHLLR